MNWALRVLACLPMSLVQGVGNIVGIGKVMGAIDCALPVGDARVR